MNVAVEQRRAEIALLLQKNGSVRVSELSKIYGISEVTVRSDLEYLESHGQLSRVHAIRGKKNISIVTNSIQNALEISSYPGINVILLGGEIDSKYQFTYGNDTTEQLAKYHANKCILSVDGISAKDGLTLYYANESGIVRGMIEASDEVIVVADATKLGRSAFSRVGALEDIDVLVTGKKDGSEEISALREMGAEVIEG